MNAIPVIDLAAARAGGESRRNTVAEIDRANREVGFLTLVNHGIDQALLDSLYAVSATFFDLPSAVKEQYARDRATSRGYVPPTARALAKTRDKMTPGDLVELFAMGLPGDPNDPYYAAAAAGPNFKPNVWPAELPEMERIWTAYYEQVLSLSEEVMALFAESLDLPTNFFADKIDRPISNLFANCYPPITAPPEPGQIRVGEHTDYGTLTLLYQKDEVGGLEVFVDGAWLGVPPTPGAYVVNIGDLMARWTNDRWISTLHRVQNPPADRRLERRISFPFFCQPNYDAVIEALPSCISEDHPVRYRPITSGENVRSKTTSSFSVDSTPFSPTS